MKEQKDYQLEKVFHSFTTELDICCLVDYYPTENNLAQFNYTDYEFSNTAKTRYSVGRWRVKPTDK